MVFQTLISLAFTTLIIAFAVRVRIFCTVQFDRVAAPLLEDTFPTTFTDFLWIHLYRQRDRIDRQHRSKIVAYFWLTVTAIVLWVAAFSAYWLAA